MQNYFLAGPAVVDMYNGDQLFATSQTLLDSSIKISVTAVDVVGGAGNQLFGKYFHTSKFDATLTDAMFKLDYLAKNIGSDVTVGANVFSVENVTLGAGGTGAILGTPTTFETYGTVGWATLDGYTYQTVTFTSQNFTFSGGVSGDVVSVKYISVDNAAQQIVVSSNIIPSTIHIVMKASLFAGEFNDLSTSTLVGYAYIDVPRFILSGSQDYAMKSSGVSQTAMSGSAAVTTDVVHGNYYALITEQLTNANWYDDVTMMTVEGTPIELASVGATETLNVYALHTSALPSLAPNSDLTFSSSTPSICTVNSSGLVTAVSAGTAYININISAKSSVVTTAEVVVA